MNKKSAYEYGVYLLSICGRSEKDLEYRLRKKLYREEDITETIHKLKKYGFLNDSLTALQLIRNRMERGKGGRAITADLLQKGFSIDIINAQLKTAEDEGMPESERAVSVIAKKIERIKKLPLNEQKKKLFSLLMRRGFSYASVIKALSTVGHTIIEDE